ncbi:hypothetical protein VTK56DRAFT_3197 [Thermocarpiscus australiensis]
MAETRQSDSSLEAPRVSLPPYPHHCYDLALQKYLLLHEQHESLRQHLDEIRPTRYTSISIPVTRSPATSPTSMSSSPDTSPHQPHSFSLPIRKTSCNLARGPAELGPMPDDSALAEVAVEEAKLCDVTEGMKRALTELLNCETVRGDRAFRTWVQSRLMDTERELRSGRRRRSAPGP